MRALLKGKIDMLASQTASSIPEPLPCGPYRPTRKIQSSRDVQALSHIYPQPSDPIAHGLLTGIRSAERAHGAQDLVATWKLSTRFVEPLMDSVRARNTLLASSPI
jgi:hypothetical protein